MKLERLVGTLCSIGLIVSSHRSKVHALNAAIVSNGSDVTHYLSNAKRATAGMDKPIAIKTVIAFARVLSPTELASGEDLQIAPAQTLQTKRRYIPETIFKKSAMTKFPMMHQYALEAVDSDQRPRLPRRPCW